MLLTEKIEEISFSPAEREVVRYILTDYTRIENTTVKEIAEKNYVHPSTLIRVAKKIGFHGWNDFKDAFLKEQDYLHNHFVQTDANLPFTENDSILTIAQKIASLEQETISDTLSLLEHKELQKATDLLYQSKQIKIFTSNANLLISQDFALKMRRIKKQTSVAETIGEHVYEAYSTDKNTCVLMISYTGENEMLKRILPILKAQGATIIVLTGIGDNTLAKFSNCHLRLATREKLYSKIGSYTTSTSVSYLLDILYSTVFAKNYQKNMAHLIAIGEEYDNRTSTSPVMHENNSPKIQVTDAIIPN
ncbi:MurR/RpiR family transcriptional regulator [Tetragenococcus muriaticus]|uniref:Sugar isomerase n=1 Tax=Tetragenococcus muriaticus 3MR10-3 TaxID=1302648 RepID=A0A091C0I8_9ENTE|nr:MurR/RpiR family transcriptional regulator [Tetragenococcus muriaticus]KFN90444.1 sugar isomerase [Tetragenococcus muriaticus 3MR10-3]GMA45799.1 RpiR family transcriptional regulator [Tetragenococcus muriaticus]GMA46831.1 RpiR family transcriptional regulator [Tetragenococcus muriaticus]